MTETQAPFTAWLSEALGQLLSCPDPDSLFAAMLRTVRARAPVAIFNVCSVAGAGHEMEILRCWSERSGLFVPGLRFRRDQSLIGEAFTSGSPLYTPDYERLEAAPPFARQAREDGVRASLVVPLFLQGLPRGSVNLGFLSRDPLAAETRSLFVALARAYGALHFWMEDSAALERSQGVDRALGRVGLLLLEAEGAREGLARCARAVAEETGARQVVIFGPGGAPLPLLAAHPATPEPGLEARLSAALEDLASWEAASPMTDGVRVLDRRAAPGGPARALLDAAAAATAVLCPLGAERPRPGWLCTFREEPRPWGEAELRLLGLTGRMAALALERHLAEQERQAAEARLRRAQALEAVGQLAGGVAHDVNNLLGSILGCAYVLELEPTAAPGELAQIRELCRRGGDLTRRLLAFARRTPGRKEPTHPGPLVRDVEALLGRTLERSVAVRCSVAEDLPTIFADRSLLTTSLLNLCLNARDAMRGAGTIALAARTEEGGLVLEVRDSGPGIPEGIRDRIFEPFFTTKPPGQGTGLGLSMVYATCQEHGGRVEVECPPEGGAAFRLWLPAAPGAAGGRAPDGGGAVHPLTSKVLLVVEDEDALARPVRRMLEAAGYRTAGAGNALDGLDALRGLGGDVALVILDLVLPGLPGDQLLPILRGLAPQVPVLVTTGREDLAPPGEAVLAKPFTAEELLRAVADALAGRRPDG